MCPPHIPEDSRLSALRSSPLHERDGVQPTQLFTKASRVGHHCSPHALTVGKYVCVISKEDAQSALMKLLIETNRLPSVEHTVQTLR